MKNLKELQNKWKLEKWDIIYFGDLKYKVWRESLECLSNWDWFRIFTRHWIDAKKFFKTHLWYVYHSDFWWCPNVWVLKWSTVHTKNNMKDLYKLSVAIYENIVNKNLPIIKTEEEKEKEEINLIKKKKEKELYEKLKAKFG